MSYAVPDHNGHLKVLHSVIFEELFDPRVRVQVRVRRLVPDERLVMHTAEGPFRMEATYTWQSVSESETRMILRNRDHPSGFGKLAAPIMASAMRRANRKECYVVVVQHHVGRHAEAALPPRSGEREVNLRRQKGACRGTARRTIGDDVDCHDPPYHVSALRSPRSSPVALFTCAVPRASTAALFEGKLGIVGSIPARHGPLVLLAMIAVFLIVYWTI